MDSRFKLLALVFGCSLLMQSVESQDLGTGLGVGLGAGLGAGLPFACGPASSPEKVTSFLEDTLGVKKVKVEPYKSESTDEDEAEKPATIKCPEDLDCDFSKECAWSNSKSDAACANHDFNLVKDAKISGSGNWSKLMGNSDVPEKEFLAVGTSKYSFPVVLVSDIVPKQPGDGELTISYWVSTPATVSVCILHRLSDYKNPTKCTPPAKNGKKSTTTFTIKGPIIASFKIMISASNFEVDEGAAVVIDNIKYESKLCSK